MNYATIDTEFLCVIATLCEFRSMLLGAGLHIHTDHKNILNVGYSSEWHLQFISYVDEYSPTLHYVKGPCNVIADTFSRLLCQDGTSALAGKRAITEDSELASYYLFDEKEIFDCLRILPCLIHKKQKQQKSKKRCRSTDTNQHCRYHHCHHDICADQCYLNLPEDMVEDNPLDVDNIKEKQDEDNEFQQSTTRHPEWYRRKTFNNVADVFCYTKPGCDPSNWKIAIPRELIRPMVNWYHQVTGHPGSKRLYEQVHQKYYKRDLQRYIENFNCEFCQRNKLDGRGYGLYQSMKYNPYHLRNASWT